MQYEERAGPQKLSGGVWCGLSKPPVDIQYFERMGYMCSLFAHSCTRIAELLNFSVKRFCSPKYMRVFAPTGDAVSKLLNGMR